MLFYFHYFVQMKKLAVVLIIIEFQFDDVGTMKTMLLLLLHIYHQVFILFENYFCLRIYSNIY